MFKVAWKSLLARKSRFVMTLLAVALGVSFIAGSYIFTDSINSTFKTLFKDVYAGIDLTVRPAVGEDGSAEPVFDESVLDQVKDVPGIAELDPDVDGDVLLIDAEGEPVLTQGPSIGFSWTPVPALNPTSIKEGNGRPPESAGEVVVDLNTAKNQGFEIGDTLKVQTIEDIEEFEIVGLLSFGSTDTLAGAIILAFEFEQAQDLFGMQDKLTEIVFKVEDDSSVDEVKAELESRLSSNDNIEVVTGDQQTQENLDDISSSLGFITTFFLAFAAIAIFVATFIIQNTFRITIAQRSKELALLRSVGASKTQIIRMVIIEAIMVGLIASLVGILLGFGLAELLKMLANAVGIGLPDGQTTIATRTIIVSLVVGLVVTVVSALMPAIRASRIPPVQALSDHENVSTRKSLAKRTVGGLLVVIAGVLALISGLQDSFWNPLYLVGIGSGLIFVGVSVLAPFLSKPFAKLVGWPLKKLYKVPAELAIGNTMRSPRRTASTASALMIGVALISFISILSASVKSTIDTVISDSFPAELVVRNQQQNGDPNTISGGVNRDFTEKVKQLDELDVVSVLRYNFADFKGNESFEGLGDVGSLLIGVDPANIDDVIKLEPVDGNYDGLQEIDTVYINVERLENLGKHVGDKVDIVIKGEEAQFTIAGSFDERFDSDYFVSLDTYDKYYDDTEDTVLFMSTTDDSTVAEAREKIDELINDYPILKVQDSAELVDEAKSQIDQILGLIWGLLFLAVLISVIGIANTLTLSISERQREIGMLRAIGMTKSQVERTIRIESVIIALFGVLLGIAMGIFFGWAIMRALRSEGLTGFVIPYQQLLIFVVLAVIAGVLASILPSWRAAKTDVLKAISAE